MVAAERLETARERLDLRLLVGEFLVEEAADASDLGARVVHERGYFSRGEQRRDRYEVGLFGPSFYGRFDMGVNAFDALGLLAIYRVSSFTMRVVVIVTVKILVFAVFIGKVVVVLVVVVVGVLVVVTVVIVTFLVAFGFVFFFF
jgi:fatty acid desaturase